MRYVFLSILLTSLSVNLCEGAESAFREIPMQEVAAVVERPARMHPRLLMTDGDVASIRSRLDADPALRTFYEAMLAKADGLLDDRPVERVKTGRRLLGVSRECLDRVIHLAAAYRFTGKEVYLRRAEREMLAAAGFSDWNPSHFLDVAEMTAALAIGYDWLYDDLSPAGREQIRQAILDKGLQPSLGNHGWVRGHNNWNQVCNGGITLGVLAILEDEQDLAKQLVHRAVNGVQVAMKQYEPDGAYPEGPGYWAYGTSYNVVLLAALESALGTDFGLSTAPGFSHCAEYYLHVAGPTGLYFNYPDSGSRGGFQPAVFWFAGRYDQPSLAWRQQQMWREAAAEDPSDLVRSRLAPLVLVWYDGERAVPSELSWMGRGGSPVAMFRTSWTDSDAVYLAIKGGSPSVSHGHMDVGSFVMEADGVRWAVDLGPENYNKIESRGMSLWGRAQDAERWTIFRYNNLSHNTLVVDGKHQRVSGHAPIVRYSGKKPFPHAVIDMSDAYEGQLAEAYRGAALLESGQVVIQDEFRAADRPATVRWAMVTPAEVQVRGDGRATLRQGDETLQLKVLTSKPVRVETWSTEPKADYDEPNPGTRLVGFELQVRAGESVRTTVVLDPSSAVEKDLPGLPPLLEWSVSTVK